jgi:fatty-acyl-CoA synthase
MQLPAFRNFNELIAFNAKNRADLPVVTMDGETWTYGRLATETHRVAALLHEAGIRQGDQVGLLLPNQPAFLACLFGTASVGAVPVLVNAFYGPKEIVQILRHSRIKLLFVQPDVHGSDLLSLAESADLPELRTIWQVGEGTLEGKHPQLAQLLERQDLPEAPVVSDLITRDDIGVSIYTSGTTGLSKGVIQTYGGLLDNARVTAALMQYSERDVLLPALPLFSSAGVSLTLISVLSGTHMILVDRNNPQIVLDAMERHRVTILDMVPSGLKLLMKFNAKQRSDISSLRLVVVGGDSCPPEVARQTLRELGCNFAVVYGLTETGPVVSIMHLDDTEEQKVSTVGPPIEGVELAIRDDERRDVPTGSVGEVCCRGPYVLPGYYRNEEATRACVDAEGWFYTGDLGMMRPDGRLVIVGRKKDMICIGGHNVFPAEIEAHLIQHARVKEVAVIGVEDARLGNQLVAFVLPKSSGLSENEVIEHSQALASFKIPHRVELLEDFPYTGSGKVDKKVLRSRL